MRASSPGLQHDGRSAPAKIRYTHKRVRQRFLHWYSFHLLLAHSAEILETERARLGSTVTSRVPPCFFRAYLHFCIHRSDIFKLYKATFHHTLRSPLSICKTISDCASRPNPSVAFRQQTPSRSLPALQKVRLPADIKVPTAGLGIKSALENSRQLRRLPRRHTRVFKLLSGSLKSVFTEIARRRQRTSS